MPWVDTGPTLVSISRMRLIIPGGQLTTFIWVRMLTARFIGRGTGIHWVSVWGIRQITGPITGFTALFITLIQPTPGMTPGMAGPGTELGPICSGVSTIAGLPVIATDPLPGAIDTVAAGTIPACILITATTLTRSMIPGIGPGLVQQPLRALL